MRKHNTTAAAALLKATRKSPLIYIVDLARISDSATAGLFMSHLLYWYDKGRHKCWIYKTIDEFEKETGIKKAAQESAIKKWRNKKALDYTVKGWPQRRYFRPNLGQIIRLLNEHLDYDLNVAKSVSEIEENCRYKIRNRKNIYTGDYPPNYLHRDRKKTVDPLNTIEYDNNMELMKTIINRKKTKE